MILGLDVSSDTLTAVQVLAGGGVVVAIRSNMFESLFKSLQVGCKICQAAAQLWCLHLLGRYLRSMNRVILPSTPLSVRCQMRQTECYGNIGEGGLPRAAGHVWSSSNSNLATFEYEIN